MLSQIIRVLRGITFVTIGAFGVFVIGRINLPSGPIGFCPTFLYLHVLGNIFSQVTRQTQMVLKRLSV
jgi:hypothetical protein